MSQSELAALREELCGYRAANMVLRDELRTERLRADAAVGDANAAEQRNAELSGLLRRSTAGDGQDFRQWWNDRATLLLACLKPTESGAGV